ncbi:hypothetical protein ES319_D13G225700v1 [Gossypium barbadense]|uniref:Cupin type-1 domain-containing protein n=1 Tax=Gossypium barbadense TaxID=3634 RepID=A0A5J5NPT0_GOSBA|nr:hypothetical protein ES319_D13G225700v1 [Gossypium barbadense]
MQRIRSILIAFGLFAFACSSASAYDPSPLQDFCVAVKDFKNGDWAEQHYVSIPKACSYRRFLFRPKQAGNTSNPDGSNVTMINVDQILGLNTLSISLVRIGYAPYGVNPPPPHTHPRGSEILLVVEGTLYVGFVMANPTHCLFTKILNPGDFNIGKTAAVAFAGLSSQNAGVITIANAAFGSNPPINPDVLAKAFQLNKNVVKYLQSRY